MSFVFKAIINAARDLMRLKIAWIIVWPILVAAFFWFIIGYIFRDNLSELTYLAFSEIGIGEWLKNIEPEWIATSIQSLLYIIVFTPLIIITTLIITTIFVMPALIKLVANRNYPELKRENGGSLSGSIINAVLASGVFVLVWVITLPLWTIGVGIIIPFVAAAFMNQQLFRYDALSEHASKQEIKIICATNRFSLWGLGLLTGFIQFVPLLNLLAPIFTALAFIHFGLGHLKRLRAESGKTSVLPI
jgi:hypothetical protein